MTIVEALKLGRPVRSPRGLRTFFHGHISYIAPNTWIAPEYFVDYVRLKLEDYTANDWEVKHE